MLVLRMAAVAIMGLGGGTVVGLALIAFLSALGVITRLAVITRTVWALPYYGWAVLAGGTAGSLLPQLGVRASLPGVLLAPLGLALGMFVGIVAASLTEVLDVMPVVGRRLRLGHALRFLVAALALGKVAGSLLYWLNPRFP